MRQPQESYTVSDLAFGETEFTIYAQNVADGKKTPSKTITLLYCRSERHYTDMV